MYKMLTVASLSLFLGCVSENIDDLTEFSVSDLMVSIDENPLAGDLIGNIEFSANSQLSFLIVEESPVGAVEVSDNGSLRVLNSSLFDFEVNPIVNGVVEVTDGTKVKEVSFTINLLDVDETILTVNDFEGSVLLNSSNGDVIGQVNASGPNPNIIYSLEDLNIPAIDVDDAGVLFVLDASLLMAGMPISGNIVVNDGLLMASANVLVTIQEFDIWSGPTITFLKRDSTDPNAEENQDRITDNVWITRGNDGGQIYNAVLESEASQNSSPLGTEWALGTVDDIGSLTFNSFRGTIQPQEVVGKQMVLHLVTDDIYIPVMFTGWTRRRGGGFIYERATPNN